MRIVKLIFSFALFTHFLHGQKIDSIQTEKVIRLNFINPSVEYEIPTSKFTSLSSAFGVGYGGIGSELYSGSQSGLIYVIAPFLDIQHKWFYNLNRRKNKNKPIINNSGNFFSARILMRSISISDNVDRKSDFDFSVGPTWGFQRSYNKKYHFLFDVGPIYYFDVNGNQGFFPIMIQINFGLDL